MLEQKTVGIIGATSPVGQCLLPLLTKAGFKVLAFSRDIRNLQSTDDITWQLTTSKSLGPQPVCNHMIPYWICVAPIWVLPEYFQVLKNSGAKRVVAFSSTSRFTKDHSSDESERVLAQRLIKAEDQLSTWAEEELIEWVILRPTLIYGLGKDKNISEIIRLIRRFCFFPLIGKANGLRQPVHVKDVAFAGLSALSASAAANKSYNLSGGETLTYKEMVERVFIQLGRKPFFLKLPKSLMQLAILILRCLPRYRGWKLAMAERMNQDLVFDHQEARRDLNFTPCPFRLDPEDLARPTPNQTL